MNPPRDPADAAPPRRWLIAILLVFLVAQPAAMLGGAFYLERWGSAGNTYNQWHAYTRLTSVDSLFVGDSRVRADVDGALVGDPTGGTRAVVASVGVDGAKPRLIRAIVGEALAREPKPRTIIVAVSEFQLNDDWDRSPAGDDGQTRQLWQLGGPPDLRYMSRALALSDEEGLLVTGWLFPLVASYSVVLEGVRCDIGALAGRHDCVDEYRDRDSTMDEATLARWRRIFAGEYLARYRPSTRQIDALAGTLDDIRRAGVEARLVVLPVYRVAEIDSAAYGAFLAALEVVARQSGVRLTDLHARYDDRPELFFNLNHLNRAGTREIAPLLRDLARR